MNSARVPTYAAYFQLGETLAVVRTEVALEFIRLTRMTVDMILKVLQTTTRNQSGADERVCTYGVVVKDRIAFVTFPFFLVGLGEIIQYVQPFDIPMPASHVDLQIGIGSSHE